MTAFDELYDQLGAFKKIVIEYAGSGDEGYIEEIRPEPEVEGLEISGELYADLEEAAYTILEESWGGWEINEGSQGHMTIDVEERSVFLHHGINTLETTYHDNVIA